MLQMIIFYIVFKKYTVLCLFWINLHFSERVTVTFIFDTFIQNEDKPKVNFLSQCFEFDSATDSIDSFTRTMAIKWFVCELNSTLNCKSPPPPELFGNRFNWSILKNHVNQAIQLKIWGSKLNCKFVFLFRMIRQLIQLICLKEPRRSSVSCVNWTSFQKTVTNLSKIQMILLKEPQ